LYISSLLAGTFEICISSREEGGRLLKLDEIEAVSSVSLASLSRHGKVIGLTRFGEAEPTVLLRLYGGLVGEPPQLELLKGKLLSM
jgi:hypothetical protein